MTVGLRVVALVIDLFVCAVISHLVGPFLDQYIPTLISPDLPLIGSISLSSNTLVILLYFPLATASTGRTFGKWICRLRVVDGYGERPKFWSAVGREALKLVALATQIGAYIAAAMVVFYNRPTWYDQLCDTDVEFIGHLSNTQKNWRKSYKRY